MGRCRQLKCHFLNINVDTMLLLCVIFQMYSSVKGGKNVNHTEFYDFSLTFSNRSSQVSCCHDDKSKEIVTCGFGTSCSGQCSALGASLCPSGACSDCEIDLDTATRSLATLTSNNLGHCAFGWPRAGCNVRDQPLCCYHPTCRQNKESCCRNLLDYLRVGNSHCGPGRRPGSGSGSGTAGVAEETTAQPSVEMTTKAASIAQTTAAATTSRTTTETTTTTRITTETLTETTTADIMAETTSATQNKTTKETSIAGTNLSALTIAFAAGGGAIVFGFLLAFAICFGKKCMERRKFLRTPKVDVNDTYGTYDTVGEQSDYSTVQDANDYYYDSMN